MSETKTLLVVVAALVVGAIIGGLIGRYAIPSDDPNASKQVAMKAQCVLTAADGASGVQGTVDFERTDDVIAVTGTVTGLTAGKHGFHVHQVGSTGGGCKDAKGHFNPFGKDHSAPDSDDRHVGDLGNIVADANGVSNISISDSIIRFAGDANILGRAIVIHAGEDDLGKGGESDSMTTGHAGARVACCIIGAM